MKILFWSDGFWPRLGGVETQASCYLEAMQKRGHQFTVLAQKDHSRMKEEETVRGIPVKRLDFNAVIAKRDLKTLRAIQTYLQWILDQFRPDIIHLNAFDRGNALVFLLFRKMFDIPVVLTAHAPYLQGKFNQTEISPIIKRIASSVDRVCCVSNWVLNEMEKHYPSIRNQLMLIYNGLPMPDSPPSPLSFSPPTLLTFGRLSWEKGFDTAIRAFSLLKQAGSNANLIVAGGGPERPALERLASELGVDRSIQFTGILSPEEVLSTYNRATLVVVPSILESFGLVILESMQLQRPVIASAVQGVSEVIADGKTGLLVPGQDPSALCRAIQTLLSQPERAIQMGLEGRKRAMGFTIDRNADQYEDLYRELKGSRG